MKKILIILSCFLLSFSSNNVYAQHTRSMENYPIECNVVGEFEPYTTSSRSSPASAFYNNLRTWIPYCNAEPLKNPPITYIEISFHVFLDDNGQNNYYTNTPEGKEKLLEVFNVMNRIYSGEWGPSDHVNGVVGLPNYDTRIRVTLGNNNDRIYFYNNTTLNHEWSQSVFHNFLAANFPERTNKLNVFFTAGYYGGKVTQENIVITNGGAGYISTPTITFNHVNTTSTNATATAVIQNGVLTGINITDAGFYYGFVPPQIIISGGGGSGATALVTELAGSSSSGYTNPPSFNLADNRNIVMCCSHRFNQWTIFNTGMCVAHELGHCLDLKHTYCGGGSSPVICSNHCSINCSKNSAPCSDDEYLSDIFGSCPGTYPHAGGWSDPFDNTWVGSEKHTNNVMGGSNSQVYFSPMQAGQMHRTLARKSTSKYVKRETYSPIPLVIIENEEWDFYLKLYRDINVASGAVLTLNNNFELPYNGTITVNSGAALVIENNVKLSENNKIIVKNGGTLRLGSASTTEISNNGYIDVQAGGYFCINSGAVIKLNDVHSVILLKPGYITGVNTSLLPSSTCVSSPTTYSIIGNGGIKNYVNNIYIQNETISSDKHYAGVNIYVGRNVTTSKPQGDVIINNNANVVFDATGDVIFEAGFECAIGASFEVRK